MMMKHQSRGSTVLGFLFTLLFDNNTGPWRQPLHVYPAQIIPNTQSNPRGSPYFFAFSLAAFAAVFRRATGASSLGMCSSTSCK